MNVTNVGVSYCQPDPEYRRESGESQSHLKNILKSPAHYQAAKNRKFFTSPVMTIGTATHCLLLEGEETFAKQFVKKPSDVKLTTKEGREWKAAQKGKTILENAGRDPQWDCVVGMTDALRELEWFDPTQKDYRKYNEVSIYWTADDIPCKARLDRVVVCKDEVLVLDLKTTDSVSIEKFQSKSVDLGYDFQAGWYSWAAELVWGKPTRFIFVAVERGAPHSIEMFEVPEHMLMEAQLKNKAALNKLSECKKSDNWPKNVPSLKTLEYPRWYQPLSQNAVTFEPLF